MWTLQNLDIPILFEKENINTGSMESELFLAILSSMAEGESVSISENSKWSVQRRFQNGTFKLSYSPYGYEWDGENMVIQPEQAKIVKRIFAETLSGKGFDAIAAGLMRDGIPARKGERWSSGTIRGILCNEKYNGDVIFQKTFTDGQFNRHRNVGQRDQYMATEHHEAIISREDFESAAQIVVQRAAEKGVVKGSRKYQNRYDFPKLSFAVNAATPSSEEFTAPSAGNTSRGAVILISRIRKNAPAGAAAEPFEEGQQQGSLRRDCR